MKENRKYKKLITPKAINPKLLLDPIFNQFSNVLDPSNYTSDIAIISDFREPVKPYQLLGISFLITDLKSLEPFRQLRLQVKEKYDRNNQEIKYTKFRAAKSRPDYLNSFINAADQIKGILCNFIVHPSLDELVPKFYNYFIENEFGNHKQKVFRKLEIYSHFSSIILSPLIFDNTLLHLISDKDNIFANEDLTKSSLEFFMSTVENYSKSKQFKLGFIDPDQDSEDIYLKDLTAIPDLSIGCLADLFNSFEGNYEGFRNGKQLFPSSVKEKAVSYSEWIFSNSKPLKRISFFVELEKTKNEILVYPMNGINNI